MKWHFKILLFWLSVYNKVPKFTKMELSEAMCLADLLVIAHKKY